MFISDLFRVILWQPLFNLLILLYVYVPGNDFGVAIIFLTILIRIILWPLQEKATKSQLVLQKIQPKIKELQKKYKNDKQKLSKEFMALYKGQEVNPFSGILILFLQLPILIALYRVFWKAFDRESFVYLYNFVSEPEIINPFFLGLLDLSKPNLILAVLVGVFQFIQIKTATLGTKKEKKKLKGMGGVMQKQMTYLMPVIIVLFLSRLPSALSLYLLVSTLFAVFQQRIVKKKLKGYEKA